MTARTYSSATAFKNALEDRLRRAHPIGNLMRERQWLVFTRFVARIMQIFGDRVVVKGGVALELRLVEARSTDDIDFALFANSADALVDGLARAATLDLGDHMTFRIVPGKKPDIEAEGLLYGGKRFRAECLLDKKVYGVAFNVDICFGGAMSGAPDLVIADDLLDFIGVPPPRVRIVPIATHIAEKIHAYSVPRPRPNSRVRDLPDMALLARTAGGIDAATLRAAIASTFGDRTTHGLPTSLAPPPVDWEPRYLEMAVKHELPWATLDEVFRVAAAFLDPALGGVDGVWDAGASLWRRKPFNRERSLPTRM